MKKLMAIVMSALSAAVAGGAFAASEIYVDAAVESAGDGLSWATAYKSVEQAVKDIEAGGTVYVKGGMYQLTESIELTGKDGVSLLGHTVHGGKELVGYFIKRRIGNWHAIQEEPLVDRQQMRRGEACRMVARRAHHRIDQRAHRALAVRAGDMNTFELAFRMAQFVEKRVD